MIQARFEAKKLRRSLDPRERPAYSIPMAAHYLQMPVTTLRSWVVGRNYPTAAGAKRFKPLIELAEESPPLLSFNNLAEAHVLCAIRREQQIGLRPIRAALDYLGRKFQSRHPLLDHRFETDGTGLFVRHLGKLVDVSASGQEVMREVLDAHLKRLEREDRKVARLYPFTRAASLDGPRSVFIDPRYAFGRPVLAGIGISTGVIAERYKAGESVDELAKDYGCTRPEIEEALRCELRLEAA
jgi:uncharacterized protein (DUF433 family)